MDNFLYEISLFLEIKEKSRDIEIQKKINFIESLINTKLTKIEKIALYYSIGLKQYLNKNYDSAIKSFNEVLYLKYEYIPALLMRALCFKKLGKLDEALIDIKTAYYYDKKNSNILLFLSLLEINRDINLSLKKINNAIKINNNDFYYISLKSIILYKSNKIDLALETINIIPETNNNNFFLFLKGFLNLKKGNFETAFNYLIKAKNYNSARFLLAKYYFKDLKKIKTLKSLFFSPNYEILSIFELYKYYLSKKKYQKAALIISKLSNKYPFNFNISLLISKILYLAKCFNSASIAINNAINLSLITKDNKIDIEQAFIFKIKILLKIKNSNRNDIILIIKILENKNFFSDEKKILILERIYRKLYEKFNIYEDFKNLKEIRKNRNLLTTRKKSNNKKTKRIIMIVIIIILIIFLLIEILLQYK